jgi:hypothetical protein
VDSKGAIGIEQVKAYSQRYGPRQTEECLRKLGVLQQFYNAYNLPLGRELLTEVNSELVRLAGRVLTDPEATSDDKNMYRAYMLIAQSWSKKINAYEEIVKDISDVK